MRTPTDWPTCGVCRAIKIEDANGDLRCPTSGCERYKDEEYEYEFEHWIETHPNEETEEETEP